MEKNVHKNVRITEEQAQHLEKVCGIYGINLSEYVRRLIDADIGKEISTQTQQEYLVKKEMIYEINRIGNNINQIVKNINMHYYTEHEKKKLFAMMQRIMRLFEEKQKGIKKW